MKERLTGAIILVALMVLLVPELLTGPVPMSSSPAASAAAVSGHAAGTGARPAHAEPPLRTYTLTLGATAPAQSVPGTPPATAAQPANGATSASSVQESAPSGSAKEEAEPAAAQAPAKAHPHGRAPEHPGVRKSAPSKASAAKPAPPPVPHPSHARRTAVAHPVLQVAKPSAHRAVRAARSSASSGRWVVQLGVFADHHNAVRLASMLERRGFRIVVSPLRVRSRSLWRVSTAPAQSRAAALHTAARLRAAGHRGDVLPAR